MWPAVFQSVFIEGDMIYDLLLLVGIWGYVTSYGHIKPLQL